MSAALTLSGVALARGGVPVLTGIDLHLPRGALTALVGASGSGKTTLLRVIAGLERPDRGTIRADGRDITALDARARRFGVVFQSYALFPHMTVAQNTAYGIADLPAAERDARVREMLAAVRLTDFADRTPGALSGGQQQRAAVARALAPAPPVLLLDEPFSALDAEVRDDLRRELRALVDRTGVTTVLVTHDQGEALSTADRMVVLHRGRIAQADAPRTVYEHPASLYTARFVGGMNLLAGFTAAGGQAVRGEARIAVHGAPDGPVTVGVRPEHLRIEPAGPLTAVVVSTAYTGAFTTLALRTDAGDELRMLFPGDAPPPPAGTTLRIGPAAGRARAFAPEAP